MTDESPYEYEEWSPAEGYESERIDDDLKAVDAALQALRGWKQRVEWRDAETDHFRRQVRRYVRELAEKAPALPAEREELAALRVEVVQLREENRTLRMVIADGAS